MQGKKCLGSLGVLRPKVLGYGRRGADFKFQAVAIVARCRDVLGYGRCAAALIIVLAALAWASGAAASTCKAIHVFKGGADGANPVAGLIFDAAGNLYGTTASGGGSGCGGLGCGVVWKLKPNASGTWTVRILHAFTGADGANPYAGLMFDAVGSLYGTTLAGGASTTCSGGCGVVFKLKPNANGTWTESVLHNFAGGADGASPEAGLIFDRAGNLFGTTFYGGSNSTSCFFGGCGIGGAVFRLAPKPDGTWTESVLHSFGGADGVFGSGGLIFDMAGNLYGMTYAACGGCSSGGTVFELQPNPDGTWTESVLHSFTGGAGGSFPTQGLILDASGNLYGTASEGGNHSGSGGCGVVFKLTPSSTGWSETVLHTFLGYGCNPAAPVIFDPAGNLYGTTTSGANNNGLVFKLTP